MFRGELGSGVVRRHTGVEMGCESRVLGALVGEGCKGQKRVQARLCSLVPFSVRMRP